MKSLLVLCSASFLVLFISCSDEIKDAGIPPDSNGKDEHLFKVFPTNSDDTENILQAFAGAMAAGPGSTVQLMSGKYFIRPIEVRDFNGYFQGYGRGITTLYNHPDIPCDDFWNKNNVPYLIRFVGGQITMSEMTIHIKDGCPCSERSPINRSKIGDMLGSILTLADYTADYTPINQHIKCKINKVDFIAGNFKDRVDPNDFSGNVDMAIYCGSPEVTITENTNLSTGTITVTCCNFEQNITGLYIRGFNENTTISSLDNVFSGNVYQNFILSCFGSKIKISKNSFLNGIYSDIYVDNSDRGYYPDLVPAASTEYNISENYFKGTPKLASLFLIDNRRISHPDEGFNQLFDIWENNFNILESGSAIIGLYNAGAKINNNFFNASGAVGLIKIDGDKSTFSTDINISGNTFENIIYSYACIYLGPYTSDCKVECSAKDKVANYGINNSINVSKDGSTGYKTPESIQNLKILDEEIKKMNKSNIYF